MKRGRGRPRVYTGLVRYRLGLRIAKNGLLPTLEALKAEGKPVSMTVLRQIAADRGIKFTLGRRPLAA